MSLETKRTIWPHFTVGENLEILMDFPPKTFDVMRALIHPDYCRVMNDAGDKSGFVVFMALGPLRVFQGETKVGLSPTLKAKTSIEALPILCADPERSDEIRLLVQLDYRVAQM